MFKSEKSLSIKTYVVFLVLGITVILAGTLGYLYSIVSRYLDDEERADKYHLSSIIFASDIKEEMQDFLIQHGNELAQKHKPGSLAGDGRPHSHTAIFDVVRQKLDEIKSLQDKFGDRRFIRILENSERHYRHVRSKVKEGVFQRDQGLNIKEIPQFIIHIDQLKRLHLVIYQTEMLDIHHRQEQDFRNFLIFLGVVSGVSFLFIFKVMLEIKKVTRRRTLTERDLFDEKERAQVTLSSIADGVITTDLGGLVDYMNPEAEKVTGFRLSQARGRAVTEIFRLQDLVPGDEERCPVSKCLNGKEILIGEREIGLLTATGSLRVIDYSVSSIFDSDTLLMGVVITFQDVTKRKVAEESARSSEQRLTLHFQQTPLAVIEWNTGFEVTQWNPSAEKIFGYTKDEALGRHAAGLIVPESVKDLVDEVWQDLLQQKGGSRSTNENTTKDGGIILCEWYNTPLVDSEDNVVGVASLVQDVTEQMRANQQLKIYTTQLEQSNRELEAFAYVSSHDLQEPLRKLLVFGDRLRDKCGDSITDQGKDYLNRMQKAADRMKNLIEDLLTFSRLSSQSQPYVTVNLHQIVKDVISDLDWRIEKTNGHIETTELLSIEADATQMYQLFQNLISNALKYSKDGRDPVIMISGRTVDRDPFGDRGAGQFYEISVQDNGIGFEERYLSRIFNLFQRLHGRSEYEGTGIGLAVCKKIVMRHNGSITAKSIPEEGSTFIVTLPVRQISKPEE